MPMETRSSAPFLSLLISSHRNVFTFFLASPQSSRVQYWYPNHLYFMNDRIYLPRLTRVMPNISKYFCWNYPLFYFEAKHIPFFTIFIVICEFGRHILVDSYCNLAHLSILELALTNFICNTYYGWIVRLLHIYLSHSYLSCLPISDRLKFKKKINKLCAYFPSITAKVSAAFMNFLTVCLASTALLPTAGLDKNAQFHPTTPNTEFQLKVRVWYQLH